MKTICANEQTVIGPKPKYFLSQLEGGIIANSMIAGTIQLIFVYFVNRRKQDWTIFCNIAAFCHN